jgi:phosphate transport system substrate-binding protein
MRYIRLLNVVALFLFLPACASSSSTGLAAQNTITNRGSDTMVNLALKWAETYSGEHPETLVSVSGGGSGTGISALINGTVDLANASRQMTPQEISDAQKNGVQPKEFVVARDAIAVIVHPSNPIDHLTLQQLSDIFAGRINNWSELGGENRPIVRVSREITSGTHVYFLDTVIRLGNPKDPTIFAADTLLLSSSEGITAEVSQNPNAIGYDGLGYVLSDTLKKIAVGTDPQGPFILPSADTVKNGEYPISRDLYMYTNGEPRGILREYLDWILSPEGQQIVTSLGFVPI